MREEVFARHVDLQPFDAQFLADVLGEGVIDRDVFQTDVRGVLQVVVVLPRQRTVVAVGGERHHARPVGILVHVRHAPVVGALVDLHYPVTRLRLHQRVVGAVPLAPEEARFGPRIPVALAHALPEHRKADAVPVQRHVDAVLVAGRLVADDLHVAVVRQRAVAFGHDAVAVHVYEPQVAGVGAEHLAVLEEVVGRAVERLGVAGVDARGAEAPDLADLHALVVGGQVAGLVVVVRNPAAAVPEHGPEAVVEGFAAQLERIAPAEADLPALGLQAGVVAVGRRAAQHLREVGTDGVEVGGVAAVVVAREREPVVEQVEVLTVDDDRRLGDRGAVGGRHRFEVLIGVDIGVAERTDARADLEVVEPSLHVRFEPRLLREAPAHRCRGEESPLRVGREFRRTVIACAQLDQIAARVGVVDTSEEADQPPRVTARRGRVILAVHQREAGLRGIEVALPVGLLRAVVVIFEVPSGHDVQVMVPSQFGGEGADDVGRDVVRNVVPVFERRVAVVLSRNVHARIVGVEVLHAVARPACALVGHVGRDFEHLRDEFEVERRGVGHFQPVVLLPRSALGEGRVSALGGGLRPCAVGVLQQRERKG